MVSCRKHFNSFSLPGLQNDALKAVFASLSCTNGPQCWQQSLRKCRLIILSSVSMTGEISNAPGHEICIFSGPQLCMD